jgi:hypothetical protein
MAGTYLLRVQTVVSQNGTWTVSPGGATSDAALLAAIFSNSVAGLIFPAAAGDPLNAQIRFTVKYYLDGSASLTEFAVLPSGFKPTSAEVDATVGSNAGATRGFLQFSVAHESPSFDTSGAKTYAYPTTLPGAKALLNEGVGYRFERDSAPDVTTGPFLLEISGAYVQVDPTVTDVAPATVPISGKAITITGTGFGGGGTLSVTIGGSAATSVVVVSDTSITCVAPNHVVGAVDVVVTLTGSDAARSGTLVNGLTYHAPTVTSVTASSGPVAGGTAVTIAGTYFGANINSVTFGGIAATSVVIASETSITCVTPARTLPAGVVDVVVTDPGDVAHPGTGTAVYTYLGYFTGGTIDDLPDVKFPPDFVWYTYQSSQPARWTPVAEPAKKGWFWADASDPTVLPFTSKAKSYATVTP